VLRRFKSKLGLTDALSARRCRMSSRNLFSAFGPIRDRRGWRGIAKLLGFVNMDCGASRRIHPIQEEIGQMVFYPAVRKLSSTPEMLMQSSGPLPPRFAYAIRTD
jgi:hypothetical protein